MWWMWTVALAGTCSSADLAKGVEAFPFVDQEQLPELAAVAAVQACKLPKPAAEALEQVAMVGPEHRGLLDLSLAAHAVTLWIAACPAGPGVLAEMGALARSEQRAHLWSACGLTEARGFTEAEWLAAPGPLLVAPLLVPAFLKDHGANATTVRAYARALAGISDRPEDNQVDAFVPLYPCE